MTDNDSSPDGYPGPTQLFVDGEWRDSTESEQIETIDPTCERRYATIEKAGAAEVDRAVSAAKEAQRRDGEWRSLSLRERERMLHRMADEIEELKEEIIRVESHDNGKTPFEAKIDVELVVDTFRYYAGWTDKIEAKQIPVPGARLDYTRREPVGVTAHIVPWNYPFQLAGRSIAPALACGNSVVVKPPTQTPCSALYYGIAAERAGIPDGVLNVLPGSGKGAGTALSEHRDVDHVAFTGSTAAGKQVMANAAENVTNVTLELGGKGPNIVFPDADMEEAVKGCQYGIFQNAGQMCWAASRLLVHEEVHDTFVDSIVDVAEGLPLGDGRSDGARMGPLVSEEHRESVQEYVQIGKDEGATLATGGEIPEEHDSGYFLEPTVFINATNDMRIAQEEIFGPVLTVIEFSDESEALEIANGTSYGLMAGVWTSDISRGHTVADRLKYGMVSVNEYPITFPQTPFGGFKDSGIGREQGSQVIDEYTQVKNINVNTGV